MKIENGIGDALVRRIIRAKRERTPWKCCIVIPLFPGFPLSVDHSDASAAGLAGSCYAPKLKHYLADTNHT